MVIMANQTKTGKGDPIFQITMEMETTILITETLEIIQMETLTIMVFQITIITDKQILEIIQMETITIMVFQITMVITDKLILEIMQTLIKMELTG